MDLFSEAGYAELRPSLVAREHVMTAATRGRVLSMLDGEGGASPLRSDFTLALAELFVLRYAEPPPRVSYSGPVFREPEGAWEAAERFEVGCEHTGTAAESEAADRALCTLLARVPDTLGLGAGTLKLGHAGLVRRPLEGEGVTGAARAAYVRALRVRAPHRVKDALSTIDERARERLFLHATALLDDAPDASPYRASLDAELRAMDTTAAHFTSLLPPRIFLRRDYADVTGIDFYTGPTYALWTPHASSELLAGGRYDALYPGLGKPWCAAGFCVRLSRLLDLAEAHPELFPEAS